MSSDSLAETFTRTLSLPDVSEQQNDSTHKELGKRPFPKDYLYGVKGFLNGPDSLSRLMTSHRTAGLRKVAFTSSSYKQEPSQQHVNQDPENIDYGYGEDPAQAPPPTKRRRMERRNSKTPAMLTAMAVSASVVAAEYFRRERNLQSSVSCGQDDEESWDGGLDIAEVLVQHLHNRRSNPVV